MKHEDRAMQMLAPLLVAVWGLFWFLSTKVILFVIDRF